MRAILRASYPLIYLLIVAIFSLSLPRDRVEAAIATTESVINPSEDGQADRARVRAFLNRAEVRAQIQAYGISAEEAIARVDNLTDREIALIVGELDRLPAGAQSLVPLILLVAVLVVGLLILGVGWIFVRLFGSQEHKAEEHKVEEHKAD